LSSLGHIKTLLSDFFVLKWMELKKIKPLTRGHQRLNCIAILYQALFSGSITRSMIYGMSRPAFTL
jgi:hypothetical protein